MQSSVSQINYEQDASNTDDLKVGELHLSKTLLYEKASATFAGETLWTSAGENTKALVSLWDANIRFYFLWYLFVNACSIL